MHANEEPFLLYILTPWLPALKIAVMYTKTIIFNAGSQGVWGIFLKNPNSYLHRIVFEYLKTETRKKNTFFTREVRFRLESLRPLTNSF